MSLRCAPLVVLAIAITGCAHRPKLVPFEIRDEPHHRLIFENKDVRVFDVALPPHASTAPHWHNVPYYITGLPRLPGPDRDFPYIQLTGNEMKPDGADPGTTRSAYTASFVKGETLPFDMRPGPMVDTNPMNVSVHYLEIEWIRLSKEDLKQAYAKKGYRESRYHGPIQSSRAKVTTFEDFFADGERVELEPNAVFPSHQFAGNYLFIAASDLDLREGSRRVVLSEGEVRWRKPGDYPAITNVGANPAFFVRLELKPKTELR